jgi:hypothetical protein
MKTTETAVSKSVQRRIAIMTEPGGKKGEKPPKNPRVPIFPPKVVPLVNLLNKILDEELNGDQVKRVAAFGLLTRLCVLWTTPYLVDWPKVRVDYVADTGLLHFDSELLRDTVTLMHALFPDGAGLP